MTRGRKQLIQWGNRATTRLKVKTIGSYSSCTVLEKRKLLILTLTPSPIHEPNFAKNGSFGPTLIVDTTNRPHHTNIAIGITTIHIIFVVQIHRNSVDTSTTWRKQIDSIYYADACKDMYSRMGSCTHIHIY